MDNERHAIEALQPSVERVLSASRRQEKYKHIVKAGGCRCDVCRAIREHDKGI